MAPSSVEGMERKIWTAAELEQLSPAERRRIFAESVITDLDQVDPEFRARIEARTRQLMAQRDADPSVR